MGWIHIDHVPGDQPVKEHAKRGQVLLNGRRRQFVLQILDESCDMERLDALERVDIFIRAPVGEAAGRVHSVSNLAPVSRERSCGTSHPGNTASTRLQ